MTKKKLDLSGFRDNTPEEDARIQAGIANDPDTWEAPQGATVRHRGRTALQQDTNKPCLGLDLNA